MIPQAGAAGTPPLPGVDLVLTLDRDIQYRAQQALAEAVAANHGSGGSIVVMDPRTGQILAMASYSDVRSERPVGVSCLRVREPGGDRHVRAGIGEQGDHRRGRARGRHHRPPPEVDGSGRLPGRRLRVPRCRASPDRADGPGGHPGLFQQHRDDPDRRDVGQGSAGLLPAPLRAGCDHGGRLPERGGGHPPAGRCLVRHEHRLHPDRAGDRRHAAADGGRLRDDRERGCVGAAEPRARHDRAGRRVPSGRSRRRPGRSSRPRRPRR